jgi:hypothetical protein
MFNAMKAGDHTVARHCALELVDEYLERGLTAPQSVSPDEMGIYIESVLRRTSGGLPDPDFSLTCKFCDGGEGYGNEEEAMDDGWSKIIIHDLPMADFMGLCPEHRLSPENE